MVTLFTRIGKDQSELPFPLLVTAHRRQMLLDANMKPQSSVERERSCAVLQALAKIREEEGRQSRIALQYQQARLAQEPSHRSGLVPQPGPTGTRLARSQAFNFDLNKS